MQTRTMPLFNRPDTLFGVCEGVGRDFGFHPHILRLSLAMMLLWNPLVVLGTYAVLGAAVALSRWIAPVPTSTPIAEPAVAQQPVGGMDNQAAPAFAQAA